MNSGTLHDPLKTRARFRVSRAIRGQFGQVLIEKICQFFAKLLEINTAGDQHRGRISIVSQGRQKVFERGVLMTSLASQRKRAMQRPFQFMAEHSSSSSVCGVRTLSDLVSTRYFILP